jgi:hypothetical protein
MALSIRPGKEWWALPTLLMVIASAGCQHQSHVAVGVSGSPEVVVSGQYVLSGGVRNPGSRSIGGETISDVVRANMSDLLVRPPMTITYVRAGPEGHTRELIDIDATGQPIDPGQDHVMRNGDELMFPMVPATKPD